MRWSQRDSRPDGGSQPDSQRKGAVRFGGGFRNGAGFPERCGAVRRGDAETALMFGTGRAGALPRGVGRWHLLW